jgi:hypothetical protein
MAVTWVIRVAPTGSKASPNVRYAFNSDRICAPQRTDAMYQTGGEQMQQYDMRSQDSFDQLVGAGE